MPSAGAAGIDHGHFEAAVQMPRAANVLLLADNYPVRPDSGGQICLVNQFPMVYLG
jgi:hypothetical protein